MRKIDSRYENPIDNILLKLCDKLIDICVKLNITPNMITLFRIILSIYIIYLLYYTDNIKLLFILIVIFHFLDCMDGHLARSTNQVTKLGDYLDHFADISLTFVIIIYMIIKKYPNKIIILTLLAFEIYMLNCHAGLQQLYYKKDNPNAVPYYEVQGNTNVFEPNQQSAIPARSNVVNEALSIIQGK